jgi:hypothetical protein
MEQLYEDPILQLMFIIGYKTVSIVLVPGSVRERVRTSFPAAILFQNKEQGALVPAPELQTSM